MPARRSRQEDSKTRIALLDAAQELMLEEGYAAVTSRRVAARAGLNTGLVYYYFGPMDELFVALFQRRAEWMLERQAQALASEQPLWALWDVIHNEANSALEFGVPGAGEPPEADPGRDQQLSEEVPPHATRRALEHSGELCSGS